MPLRRRRTAAGSRGSAPGFLRVAAHVDRAKAALLAAVPSPRGVPGTPLAEALLAFEAALREAAGDMPGWRTSRAEAVWRRCEVAIEDALAAAEALRLQAPRLDFESLVSILGGLMDPLDAFEEAERVILGR